MSVNTIYNLVGASSVFTSSLLKSVQNEELSKKKRTFKIIRSSTIFAISVVGFILLDDFLDFRNVTNLGGGIDLNKELFKGESVRL